MQAYKLLNLEAELVPWLELAMAIPVNDRWTVEGRVGLASYLVSLTSRSVTLILIHSPALTLLLFRKHIFIGSLLETGEEALVWEEQHWTKPSLPELQLVK